MKHEKPDWMGAARNVALGFLVVFVLVFLDDSTASYRSYNQRLTSGLVLFLAGAAMAAAGIVKR